MGKFEIKKAEFVKGIRGTDDILLDSKKQIAFVGRSNVGKSSMINSLLGRKDLARSSSTPGRTQEINFFLVNDEMYFVDLPGYGFAKMRQVQREKLRKLIIWYLSYSDAPIEKVVLIIDANVGVKDFDRDMIDVLKQEGHKFLIVANKADKIKPSQFVRQSKEIEKQLSEAGVEAVFYSSKTQKDRDVLLEKILN